MFPHPTPVFRGRTAAVTVACLAAALCCAAGFGAGGDLSGYRPADAVAGASRRVFVMTNGRVEEGVAVETPGGYVLHRPYGTVLLPSDLIDVVAANRRDAYFQLRGELRERDGTGRVKLAGWCATNGLHAEARTLILQALEVEPDRDDWRVKLTAVERRVSQTAAADAGRPPSLAAARGSSGGLSTASVRDFRRFVQPVLLSRCANAGCHGGTTASHFQLKQPAKTAAISSRNLQSTLPFVGGGGTWDSPLLSTCANRTDRRGRTPFHGPRGESARTALATWAARVARESPPAADTPRPPVPTGAGGADDADARPVRPDAFDPHAFNRRFAAPVGGGPTPGSEADR